MVILTALPVEYHAVRARLKDPTPYVHACGARFDMATLDGRPVVLGLVGTGTSPSAVLTEHTIAEFAPLALLSVGIAGGLHNNLHIGDIVVATHVQAYHVGREDPGGFAPHPRTREAAHDLVEAAHHVAEGNAWWSPYQDSEWSVSPRVHFGPIATGDVVTSARDSAALRLIHHRYREAVAVDMDSAGFGQAARLNRHVPALAIRGISNLADGYTSGSGIVSGHRVAGHAAAAFATALVAELA